jgi:hypothetical protein
MLHSTSPQGRRLTEQMYTCDPFHIDIKLNSDSKNRSAEIANVYLKTIGRRLVFIKRKKQIKKPISISPISFEKDPIRHPISFIPTDVDIKDIDVEKDYKERLKLNKKRENTPSPIVFEGRRMKR